MDHEREQRQHMGAGLSDPLWQPAVNVQLSALELMDLADAHLLRARNAATGGQSEVQQFHESRADELRQRVANIAPHLLLPKNTGLA